MELKLTQLESVRRDAILNAALKEFALKGYDDASTNVIARDSGISKGLLFHYVNSKKDLFLFLYDYCTEMIDREYFELMNFSEADLFERLRQSYLLQLDLLRRHPWIFAFSQMTVHADSAEIRKDLEVRQQGRRTFCRETLIEKIDESKFRKDLDAENCKQYIYWLNVGFTEEILAEMRDKGNRDLQYDEVVNRIDGFFTELRKIFYR